MSDQTLYLFKTTRRPLYRRENLNLLAAERGTVHEYAWNRLCGLAGSRRVHTPEHIPPIGELE